MAKLFTKDNRIQRKLRRYAFFSVFLLRFGYVILGSMLSALLFSIYAKEVRFLYVLFPGILFFAVCQLVSVLAGKQAAVLNAGVVGENATRHLIRHLPGAYTAVSNVRIDFEGNTSELDMVVVGPTGVFVIETKNYAGNITGRADDTTWKRVKYTEYGRKYTSSFYSPVKQVSTHTYRLSKFLKENKLFVWVQGAVYFSDPQATLKITGNTDRIPIFRADTKTPPEYNRMLSYIRNFPVQKRLSPKTVDRIVRLLRA